MKPVLPRWRVEVAEHRAGRYEVAGQVLEVMAEDEQQARIAATRAAHIVANVPSWKPLMRQTYPHTSARLLEAEAA
jgi:hypothetical protein